MGYWLQPPPREKSVTATGSMRSLRNRMSVKVLGEGHGGEIRRASAQAARVQQLTLGCCIGVQGLLVRQKRGRSKNDKGGRPFHLKPEEV